MARTRTPAAAPPQGQADTPHIEIRPGSVLSLLGAKTVDTAEAPKSEFGKSLTSAANSIRWQCRKGLYPVAACTGLAVIAHGMHDSGADSVYVLGGTAAIAVGCVAITKVRNWLGKALWRKNWAAGALSLATVWTAAGVQQGVGMDTPMPTLLIVGGSVLAAPWWWFNRPRPAAASAILTPQAIEFAPEPTPAIEEGPHPDQKTWDAKISPQVLKGSFLLDREEIIGPDGKPNGSAWIIDGSEKNIASSEMFQQLEKIKGAYDRNFSDSLIYIEGSPVGRKTQSRLILLERNPLRDVVRWEKPLLDRKTGVLPFAVYPDGSGWAKYRLFKPGWGPTHDLFAGGTGSGKTTAMKQVAIESMAMGSAVLLFDPHQGAEFEDSVPYFTDQFLNLARIYVGFFGVEAVLDERMKMRYEIGKKSFGPDHGHPIVHVMFDEAVEPLADAEINRIVARIAAEGRKAWVKLSLAIQVPSVENLGNAGGAIRENISSGNILLYRITQRTTGAMAYQGTLPIDPVNLPENFDNDPDRPTYGLGYVLNGLSRPLQSRSMLVEDEMFAHWITKVPQLDERSAEAMRRGINRGLQVLAQKRPDLLHLLEQEGQEGAENVTQIRSARKAEPPADELAARVLEFIRACDGGVQATDVSAALKVGAGTITLTLGDLAQGGWVCQTDRGYMAAS